MLLIFYPIFPYQHESALIEDVRSVIIEAAEECIPLWYRVWMEIDEFKVEEEQITTVSVIL